jgi:hypothetical protein
MTRINASNDRLLCPSSDDFKCVLMNDSSAVITNIQRDVPKAINGFHFVAGAVAGIKSATARRIFADANPSVPIACFACDMFFWHNFGSYTEAFHL